MRRLAPLLIALAGACSRNGGSQPAVRPDDPPKVDASSVAPKPSAAPSVCATDGDCHWNDECFATACLPGPAKPYVGCDESAPKPGACRCLEGTCATVYAKTSGACASSNDCDWDDECMPKRCEKRPKRPAAGCDKSYPRPGDCECVAGICASVTRKGK